MKKDSLIGPITLNTKGVGFFDPTPEEKNRENNIEIQPKDINRALNGDTVEIVLTGEKIKNRVQGKVVKIIKRAKDEFVGVITKKDGKTFVVPDDQRLYVDIFLSEEAGVAEGEIQVLCSRFTSYHTW
jgi:exoribonuclease R